MESMIQVLIIIHGEVAREVSIPEADWHLIAYVDYIEIFDSGELADSFLVHTPEARRNMLALTKLTPANPRLA